MMGQAEVVARVKVVKVGMSYITPFDAPAVAAGGNHAASGLFFTVGGGQGRFRIASNGTVAAVDATSSVGKRYQGRSQADFSAEIRAVS